jgi:hypothetical protein
MFKYPAYVLRWAVLAYPGARIFEMMERNWVWFNNQTFLSKLIVSQAMLGAFVYWLDKWIFSWGDKNETHSDNRRNCIG